MALEFEKIVPQVEQMGIALANRTQTVEAQTRIAGEKLMQLNDLDAIWAQIMIARDHDAGFRGAGPFGEPINQPLPLPACPSEALILAADGSQVYPDTHGAALYWLTNIGIFVYPHGTGSLPEMVTEPLLYYRDEDVRDSEGRVITNAAINAKRGVFEMQMLAREARQRRRQSSMIIGLYDGPLLSLPKGKDVPDAQRLEDDYHSAFEMLNALHVGLAGYVDRPKSTFVVSTVHLMSLQPHEITRSSLQTAGSFEGLTDRDLYQWILGPGDRSGLMIQQSPQNKNYTERNADHEIVFFYLNVSSPGQPAYLSRVEIPMWVAKNKLMINAIHGLLYAQCQITDRYPYSLTRADEIAVVQSHEKSALDEMIVIELLRNHESVEISKKLNTKGLARSPHQQYK